MIASVLSLSAEAVPHFLDGNLEDGDAVAKRWLRQRGLVLVKPPFGGTLRDVLLTIGACNPGLVYLLSGYSRTGCAHVVVCQDDQIVHAPSLTDAGIVGPHPDTGCFWISFIVPELAAARWPTRVECFEEATP